LLSHSDEAHDLQASWRVHGLSVATLRLYTGFVVPRDEAITFGDLIYQLDVLVKVSQDCSDQCVRQPVVPN
jgi:hypothetical protein